MMKNKGQGALEYLLLIGGAIVVAVIVVTLLLGTGTTSTAQTTASNYGAVCSTQALREASPNNEVPNCGDVTSAPNMDTGYIWDTRNNKCVQCQGTYPSCTTGTITTATVSSQCFGSSNQPI